MQPPQQQRRAFLIGLAGLGLTLIVSPAQARITEIGDAINKAGRQRMLSQRMAKAYCQIGLNILPERSAKILAASRKLFAAQLAELKAYAPTPDIKESYVQLDQLWARYDALLAGKPGQDAARQITVLNEDVLRIAHLATTQLELHAGSNVGRLINIAGRQRMLSQRMAKFYMFRQWGIATQEMNQEAEIARREFISALDALSKSRENDRLVNNELELARMQWMFFEQALKQQDTGRDAKTYTENVATTSERLLEVMDRVTGHYARISAAGAGKG